MRKIRTYEIFGQITRLLGSISHSDFSSITALQMSPVNMVASYHRLHSERSMQRELKSSNQPNVCLRGCDLKDPENSKIRTSKFNSNGKFEIMRKYAPTKISCYAVLFACLRLKILQIWNSTD